MNFNFQNPHRQDNEEALEEMLSHLVFRGKVDMAKRYLHEVRATYSKYETWCGILGVQYEEDRE